MADEKDTPQPPLAGEEEPPPGPQPAEDEDEALEEFEDRPYNAGDFHNLVHKQVINAVVDTLSEAKMHWEVVAPFLDTAREMCRGDFVTAGSVQLHALVDEGGEVAEAEEAYVEFSIADQDDGHVWFEETFWLSDIVLTNPDPAHVLNSVRALERSIARLNAWVAEQEAQAPAMRPGDS